MIAKPCETHFVMNCQICRRNPTAGDPPIAATPAAVTPVISATTTVLPAPTAVVDPVVQLAMYVAAGKEEVAALTSTATGLQTQVDECLKKLAGAKTRLGEAQSDLRKAVTDGQ